MAPRGTRLARGPESANAVPMPLLYALVTITAVAMAMSWATLPPLGAVTACMTLGAATCGLLAWLAASPRTQCIVSTRHTGNGSTNELALTFDDGPDPRWTPRVLELLAAHGARATFFVVGERAERHPDLVRAIADAGHQLGTHSFSHGTWFHCQRRRALAADIRKGVDAVTAIVGRAPLAFRPPLGLRVPHLQQAWPLVGLPLTCVTWTTRGLDARAREPGPILRNLLPALRPGAILTLHDGAGLGGSDDRTPTLRALAELLPAIAERGLRSVRLDELPFSPPWRAWLEAPEYSPRTTASVG
jgi:peptidoglycan-N-acetylglucosamine deacetylase